MRPCRLKTAIALNLSLALAACSSLPRSGPSTSEIEDRFKDPNNPLGVQLVRLSPEVVQQVAQVPPPSLGGVDRLGSHRVADQVGPGDVLAISVYEAGPGLFNPSPRQTTEGQTGSSAETLPRVQVDRAGEIAVPFAGMVKVGGHTTSEIEKIIAARLAEKAVEPQVIVTLVSGDTNSLIVSGDVKNPGRRPLSMAEENLLDVIAISGGAMHDPADTIVKVTRGGKSAQTRLAVVEARGSENIRMQPGDRVSLAYAPRSLLIFGAAGRVAQMPLEREQVSLAEALARAGGLDDGRANPSSVYLFRFETPQSAKLLHLSAPQHASRLPVVYQADLRDPQNLFLLQGFATEDKDLIYIANASSVQLYKFLQLLYTLVTPAVTGRQLSQ